MGDIAKLSCSQEFRLLNFELTAYFDENRKIQPMFEMTKDGFLLLVERYNGNKVNEAKEQIISEFNKGKYVILKHYVS